MSVKGKERAIDLDADDDEDAGFFMKKRKTRVIPRYSPVRSPSPILILDDSDDEEAKARAKKAKPKKPAASTMPDWTRSTSGEARKKRSVGRGSTEERKSQALSTTPIVIDSSPEKAQDIIRKKKRELTPPPEMSETEKAKIAQAIKSAFSKPDQSGTGTEEQATPAKTSTIPSASAVDDVVKPVFRMSAPREKKESASAKAIEHYEKRRIITLGRTQPLEYAVSAFAVQIRKTVEEIVVTYKGDRLHSILLTPSFLDLDYDAEFVCYEKDDYIRIEAERKAAREREEEEDRPPEPYEEEHASQSSEPAEIESDKVRITLSGAAGQVPAVVQPHVTAASLCRYYLSKTGQEKSEDVRLSIDGETVDPTTTFGEMEVEQGEQIDVKRI